MVNLTKREYFAGLAMQGLLANSTLANDTTGAGEKTFTFEDIAYNAVKQSDILLEELELP